MVTLLDINWKMGTTVEIRDIKIINQCLEMQGCACVGGWCVLSLSATPSASFRCTPPFIFLFTCALFFSFVSLSGGGGEQSPGDVFKKKQKTTVRTRSPVETSQRLIWQ